MEPPTSSSASGTGSGSTIESSTSYPSPSSSFKLRPSALSSQTKYTENESPNDQKDSPLHPSSTMTTSSKDASTQPPGKFLLRPSVLRVPETSTSSSSSTTSKEASAAPAEYQFAPLSSESVVQSTPAPTTTVSHNSTISENGVASTSKTVEASKVNGTTEPSQGEGGNFVFGQNLQERAVFSKDDPSEEEEPLQQESTVSKIEAPKGLSSLNPPEVIAPVLGSSGSPSSSSSKRKYEAITGEEDESNVLQVQCKLYHWEGNEWKEKGKGCLKLNDKKVGNKLSSRLVMRTTGSLKVILNSSLLPGMNVSKATESQLRLTNIDGIYSVKGKEKEVDLLYNAIDCRLKEQAKRIKSSDIDVPDVELSKTDEIAGRHDEEYDCDEESEGRLSGLHGESPTDDACEMPRASVDTTCSSTAGVTGEDDSRSVGNNESSQESDHFHTIRDTREDSNTNDASN